MGDCINLNDQHTGQQVTVTAVLVAFQPQLLNISIRLRTGTSGAALPAGGCFAAWLRARPGGVRGAAGTADVTETLDVHLAKNAHFGGVGSQGKICNTTPGGCRGLGTGSGGGVARACTRGTQVSPVKTRENASSPCHCAYRRDAHSTLWGHNAAGSDQ